MSGILSPELMQLSRRSFVHARLLQPGARFEPINGGPAAVALGGKDEPGAIAELALCDLSLHPRTGFKGRGAVSWLESQGLTIPAESNRAALQESGVLALRLSPGEALLLGNLAGDAEPIRRIEDAWTAGAGEAAVPRGFPVPRQDSHAWLIVTGRHAATLFAKLCAVDLRPSHFAEGQVAQTSAARVNVILVRQDIGTTPAFHVLVDSAFALYFWDCLIDAMAEFGGVPVGLDALLQAAQGRAEPQPGPSV